MAAFSVSGASELLKRVLDESNKAWGEVFVGFCSRATLWQPHPSLIVPVIPSSLCV